MTGSSDGTTSAPDLHQLRAFVAVSRYGTVARAAESLRLTPSPVSRTVRELEKITGPLFERGYHDMRLTERGRMLLPHAVGIVRRTEDLVLLSRGEEPPVRWSASPWIPSRFADSLGTAVGALGRAVEVGGAVSSVLLTLMVHGELDVAVVHLPVSSPSIATAPLARYQFALAVSSADPLAGRIAVSPADLRGRRVLLLPTSMQPEAMSALHAWANTMGASSVDEVGLDEVPLLPSLLRLEQAVTLGLAQAHSPVPDGPTVRWVPFAEEPLAFLLGLAWRADDAVRRPRLEAVAAALRPDQDALAIID